MGINIPQLFNDDENTYPLTSLNLTKVPDRVPTFSLVYYAGIAPSTPWSNYQTIYELKDNLTWIRGAHTIKTGFTYSYEIKSNLNRRTRTCLAASTSTGVRRV